MNLQEFERAVLKLAFETDARITTATVAYYLGVPSREANELLNQLLTDGLLELDSDDSGNLFYTVANQGDADMHLEPGYQGFVVGTETVSTPTQAVVSTGPQGVITAPVTAIVDAPITPPVNSPVIAMSTPDGPVTSTEMVFRPGQTTRRSSAVAQPVAGLDGTHGYGVVPTKTRSWSPLIVSRDTATDGSVSPFMTSMVVSKDVTCEPQPFTQPTMIQCDELATTDDSWFGVVQPTTTAMVPANPQTAVMEYDIDQPEHQPGMALLLSLILCGTGQIYNGEVWKGVTMMAVCFLLWFVLLGWVVHIWSIVDAVVIAERLNRRQPAA